MNVKGSLQRKRKRPNRREKWNLSKLDPSRAILIGQDCPFYHIVSIPSSTPCIFYAIFLTIHTMHFLTILTMPFLAIIAIRFLTMHFLIVHKAKHSFPCRFHAIFKEYIHVRPMHTAHVDIFNCKPFFLTSVQSKRKTSHTPPSHFIRPPNPLSPAPFHLKSQTCPN